MSIDHPCVRIISFPLNANAFVDEISGVYILVDEVNIVIVGEPFGRVEVVLEDLQMSRPLSLPLV